MVIAGYSPIASQIGVSSGLAALSAWNYFEEETKNLLIQIGFHNNLEETLLGMKKGKREGFFETKGIDELLRIESIGSHGEAVIERAVLTLHCGEGKFHLLPSTTKVNESIYKKEVMRWLPSMIERCKKEYDYIFIDVGWEQKEIWEELEKIVDQTLYFFPQNRWMFEKFEQREFRKNQSIVLAKYMDQSFFNESNIKILFPKLGKHIIGTIPYQYQYMDSWSKGSGMKYLAIQCDIEKRERNIFWEQIGRVMKKLKREEIRGKKDRMERNN